MKNLSALSAIGALSAAVVSCLALFALSLILFAPQALAQADETPPSCASVSDDPDGDGFGWVVSSQTSCIVTSETALAPEFINAETGQAVQLERAYWDANADLADRNISCLSYTWNETSLSYEASEPTWFRFAALPEQPPWVAHYWSAPTKADLDDYLPLVWSMDFGIFSSSRNHYPYGIQDFPAAGTRWVETITTDSGSKALRFWTDTTTYFGSLSDVNFYECSDASGESLDVTGRWDKPATLHEAAYISTAVFFTGKQEPQPVIFNRKTGEQVLFKTGSWEIQTDLIYRTLNCTSFTWNETEYVTNNYNGFTEQQFQPRFVDDPINSGTTFGIFDGVRFFQDWTVVDQDFNWQGEGVSFANSMWYEPISNQYTGGRGLIEGAAGTRFKGVRYWGSPDQPDDERSKSYQDCYAQERPSRGIYTSPGGVALFRPTSDQSAVIAAENGDTNNGQADSLTTDAVDPANTQTDSTPDNSATSTIDSDVEASGGGAVTFWFLLPLLIFPLARRK